MKEKRNNISFSLSSIILFYQIMFLNFGHCFSFKLMNTKEQKKNYLYNFFTGDDSKYYFNLRFISVSIIIAAT